MQHSPSLLVVFVQFNLGQVTSAHLSSSGIRSSDNKTTHILSSYNVKKQHAQKVTLVYLIIPLLANLFTTAAYCHANLIMLSYCH